MMRCATLKSSASWHRVQARCTALAAVFLASIALVIADEPLPADRSAFQVYQQAKSAYERDPEEAQVAWQFGRACFEWAEFSTNDTQRATLAREGIGACENAVEQEPDSAAAYYFLGMNQGQLARTMSLAALKLVGQMESHFAKARELDPEFAFAGPDRNLGLLYLEAPGWPVSVGSRSKARSHLHKAVELAPYFPENPLNLMEAYQRWKDTELLRRELKDWERNLEAARKQFSGARWRSSWPEWDKRLEVLKERLANAPPDLRSPRARG